MQSAMYRRATIHDQPRWLRVTSNKQRGINIAAVYHYFNREHENFVLSPSFLSMCRNFIRNPWCLLLRGSNRGIESNIATENDRRRRASWWESERRRLSWRSWSTTVFSLNLHESSENEASLRIDLIDVSAKSPCRTDAFVRSSEIRHDIDERTKASVLRFRSITTLVGNVLITGSRLMLNSWMLYRPLGLLLGACQQSGRLRANRIPTERLLERKCELASTAERVRLIRREGRMPE